MGLAAFLEGQVKQEIVAQPDATLVSGFHRRVRGGGAEAEGGRDPQAGSTPSTEPRRGSLSPPRDHPLKSQAKPNQKPGAQSTEPPRPLPGALLNVMPGTGKGT